MFRWTQLITQERRRFRR